MLQYDETQDDIDYGGHEPSIVMHKEPPAATRHGRKAMPVLYIEKNPHLGRRPTSKTPNVKSLPKMRPPEAVRAKARRGDGADNGNRRDGPERLTVKYDLERSSDFSLFAGEKPKRAQKRRKKGKRSRDSAQNGDWAEDASTPPPIFDMDRWSIGDSYPPGTAECLCFGTAGSLRHPRSTTSMPATFYPSAAAAAGRSRIRGQLFQGNYDPDLMYGCSQWEGSSMNRDEVGASSALPKSRSSAKRDKLRAFIVVMTVWAVYFLHQYSAGQGNAIE